jgi:hypothetical protein
MVQLIIRVNQDIIQVSCTGHIKKVFQCVIDIALEGSQAVGQSEGQDLVLEETIVGLEGC